MVKKRVVKNEKYRGWKVLGSAGAVSNIVNALRALVKQGPSRISSSEVTHSEREDLNKLLLYEALSC